MNLIPFLKFYFAPITVLLYSILYCYSNSLIFYILARQICLLILSVCISWIVAYAVWEWIHFLNVSPSGKCVLITGCDSGFGHNLAVQLDQFGE